MVVVIILLGEALLAKEAVVYFKVSFSLSLFTAITSLVV